MKNDSTTVYIFPGQGSQAIGMGRELFDKYPHLVRQADEIVGYSIKELCLEDPQGVINLTQYTQVALYVVNSLGYLEEVRQKGVLPDFLAGHSIGEFNALFAAGAFDFLTGVEIVAKRGELMEKASGGGMAAVIGMPPEKISQFVGGNGNNRLSIANLNSPQQIVIAGPKEDIEQAIPVLKKNGAEMVIPLKVSAAFHSPYMNDAAEEFRNFLGQYRMAELRIPVISNYTARPHQDKELVENLSLQLRSPVRWTESVEYLLEYSNPMFIEIGSRNILTKLVNQIKTEVNSIKGLTEVK
ncbi:ACP S-malonyltransferase [Bacillus atrophaeus]|uniref:ACP S-malonyltransferase n=1 Tax=Bacillus atrophaeus TaxID=1452 RepID=UPI001F0A273B|nr:ACP S-malonyltransferase [Bacillus atrophaeus]WNV78056.1 ACP S-malonyltransferase [Bacillus atrophaeus]